MLTILFLLIFLWEEPQIQMIFHKKNALTEISSTTWIFIS